MSAIGDLLRAAWRDGTHAYLSTACLHGQHEHCRSTVAADGGPKQPGTCKYCSSVCCCLVCDHRGANTPPQADPDEPWPVVLVDPRYRFGQPLVGGLGGTRTGDLADMVAAGETVDVTAEEYGRTRHEVLLACWYEATGGGYYHKLWGAWAEQVGPWLAGHRKPLDVDALPDPPTRADRQGRR